MESLCISVILPAAGSSTRYNGHTSHSSSSRSDLKQFVVINGKAVILHTLDRFLELRDVAKVREVVIAVGGGDVEYMCSLLKSHGYYAASGDTRLLVVSGGQTRHSSIYNALRHVQATTPPTDHHIVVIHDGVRPVIDIHHDLIPVCLAAERYGAAGLTRPLVSTVVRADHDGFLRDVLQPREEYAASEMPQAFRYGLLVAAYGKLTADDINTGTECLHLVQKYENVAAKLITGSENLFKVTYRRDLTLARHYTPTEHDHIKTVMIVSDSEKCAKDIQDIISSKHPHATFIQHTSHKVGQRVTHIIIIAQNDTLNSAWKRFQSFIEDGQKLHICKIVSGNGTRCHSYPIAHRNADLGEKCELYDYTITIGNEDGNGQTMASTYPYLSPRFKQLFVKLLDDSEGIFSGQVFYV